MEPVRQSAGNAQRIFTTGLNAPSALTLDLHEVDFSYGDTPALQGLVAKFSSKRIALLGPNGAGKSTLMKILDTSARPDSGTLVVDGVELARPSLRQYRSRLGVVPQSLDMLPGYTCADLLRYVCWLRRVSSADVEGRIVDALESVDLSIHAKTAIRRLSGGMRQRLALAQALVNRPTMLLLDEPTVGLDPHQRVQFRNVVSRLQDTTVVFATHLVDDVAHLADELAVINHGRIVWCGTTIDFVSGGDITGAAIETRYIDVTTG